MDPITATLVAAIASGATAGASEVGKSALVDAYNGVKALIKRKFGKTNLPVFIDDLENNPEDTDLQKVVQKKIESADVHKDPEILKEIEMLVEVVKQMPNVEEKLAKYNLTIKDSKIGAIGDHMNITGGIHIS